MFTLALVLAMIWIIDALKKKMQTLPKFLWYLVSFIIVAVTCLIAMNLSLDYDSHAVLIGYFLYLFMTDRLLLFRLILHRCIRNHGHFWVLA